MSILSLDLNIGYISNNQYFAPLHLCVLI